MCCRAYNIYSMLLSSSSDMPPQSLLFSDKTWHDISVIANLFPKRHLHAETARVSTSGSLALHFFRDLDVDFEEFGNAAVEADGLALVEVGFAVGWGDALLGASLDEPVRGNIS